MNINDSLECPVCGGHQFYKVREVFDDRYGQPDLFHLIKCSECNHIMTSPMLREDQLPHLYGTYYPRKKLSPDAIAREAKKINRPFSTISRWWMGTNNQGQYSARPGEKMLDIGCGSGLSLLEAQALGVDVWGVEADPNVKRIAESLNLRIHQGNINDVPFNGIKFDLIVLNQVIEHIPEPDKALEVIRNRLATNGRVILVFPNINSFWCKISRSNWINWHIPYHLHHFTNKTFTKMAMRCGYKVLNARTITPNIWTILQLRSFRRPLLRGQPNPLWNVKESTVSDSHKIPKYSYRKILLPVIMFGIAVINRSIDFLGAGDSLVVELRLKDTK